MINGCWYYQPTKEMKAAGFKSQRLGPVMTLKALDTANGLNREWDRIKTGASPDEPDTKYGYPLNTVGWAFKRCLVIRAKSRTALGKAPRRANKDDWQRAWKRLGPRFGRRDPRSIKDEELLDLQAELLRDYKYEANRTLGVWRQLHNHMAGMGLVTFRPAWPWENPMPPGRTEFFLADEVERLIKVAWDTGYRGIACAIALAWDTSLSPVDVRTLTMDQLKRHKRTGVVFFDTARKKTENDAIGTVTSPTLERLGEYLGDDPPPPDQPFLRTRGNQLWKPQPYSEVMLARDFAAVRKAAFGGAETRRISDVRRSSAKEAKHGGATREQIGGKLSNTIGKSDFLADTYIGDIKEGLLDNAVAVDQARLKGREVLRTAIAEVPETGFVLLRKVVKRNQEGETHACIQGAGSGVYAAPGDQ